MPQRPPSHQKKSTRPPCPRSGGFSPCRAGAARAPAKGAEPAEGARAMRRDTRGAAAPSAHRSIPGAAGEARGGDAARCWWRRRGKISFVSQLFRRPWWKMENERSVEGTGCRQRRRGSAPRGREGARRGPERHQHQHRVLPAVGPPRPAAALGREVAARCGGSPGSAAAHPTRSRPRSPGVPGTVVPRHWGRRRGPRRIRRDRAGVSLPGPETPCPIPASQRCSRRDPSPDRPPRGGDGGATAAAPVSPSQ